jgi:hypothetical protein
VMDICSSNRCKRRSGSEEASVGRLEGWQAVRRLRGGGVLGGLLCLLSPAYLSDGYNYIPAHLGIESETQVR